MISKCLRQLTGAVHIRHFFLPSQFLPYFFGSGVGGGRRKKSFASSPSFRFFVWVGSWVRGAKEKFFKKLQISILREDNVRIYKMEDASTEIVVYKHCEGQRIAQRLVTHESAALEMRMPPRKNRVTTMENMNRYTSL